MRLLPLLLLLICTACHHANIDPPEPTVDCEAGRPVCEHPRSNACFQRQIAWANECLGPDEDEDAD